MAKGTPDWYKAGLSQNVVAQFDVGELAARLYSPVNYDRTGKVFFIDTFDKLDALVETLSVGETAGPAFTDTVGEFGGGSILCSVAAGAGNGFTIKRYARAWVSQRLSVEWGFAVEDTIDNVSLYLGYDNLSTAYEGLFYFTNDCTEIWYGLAGGGFAHFDDVPGNAFHSNVMNVIKMVINPVNASYELLQMNDLTWDISGVALPSVGSVDKNHVYSTLGFLPNLTDAFTVYVDRVIFSEDE